MADRGSAGDTERVAIDWAVLEDDRPLTRDERRSLEEWLASDVRRLGAYARARAGLIHVARAKALGPSFDPQDYRRRHESRVDGALDGGATTSTDRALGRRGILLGGAGLATAGVAVALGFSWQAAAQTVSTKRGEVRLVPLPNGSTMTLNTETTVSLRFDDGCDVELLDGEAVFDIANKRRRPFTIRASATDIRTTAGTFAVSNLRHQPLRLVVEQGFAEVRPDQSEAGRCRVAANGKAVVAKGRPTAVTELAPNAIARSLVWRDGKLSFEDTPLRTAIAEFARYSDTRILLADPGFGDETITGLFSANNPIGFAEAAAASLDLLVSESDGTVVIRGPEKKV